MTAGNEHLSGGPAVLTRREMLGAVVALPFQSIAGSAAQSRAVEVNDVQSQLNATRVSRIVKPGSIDDIQAALASARKEGRALSIAGGRHSMGGQQVWPRYDSAGHEAVQARGALR